MCVCIFGSKNTQTVYTTYIQVNRTYTITSWDYPFGGLTLTESELEGDREVYILLFLPQSPPVIPFSRATIAGGGFWGGRYAETTITVIAAVNYSRIHHCILYGMYVRRVIDGPRLVTGKNISNAGDEIKIADGHFFKEILYNFCLV